MKQFPNISLMGTGLGLSGLILTFLEKWNPLFNNYKLSVALWFIVFCMNLILFVVRIKEWWDSDNKGENK